MRVKDYPELIFDDIPKLYEAHFKVFITNLVNIEEQLQRLPKQFCKMYTTRSLADQLLLYLRDRHTSISEQCFYIVEDLQPFQLRLSDNRRLEAMMCAGNCLGSSLMVLIRKPQGGRLLCYYSAVQQEDLWRLMGSSIYHSWIAAGTETLYLNLDGARKPLMHVDYDAIAKGVINLYKNSQALLKLPLFGYECLVARLAFSHLYGHMKLMGIYEKSFHCLSVDKKCFNRADYSLTCLVYAINDNTTEFEQVQQEVPLLKMVDWSPVPTRSNLLQLCSLLRPQHVSAIVGYQTKGNVPQAPSYVKQYLANVSPKVATEAKTDLSKKPSSLKQTAATSNKPEPTQKSTFRVMKKRRVHFVDDDESSST